MILGRGGEQARIERFLSLLRGGRGGSLVLIGEPGIGKTTLLDWTAEAAADITVLRAAGRESEADIPFVAIADLLRPVRDRLTLLPERQAEALRSGLMFIGPATAGQGTVSAAVLDLLGALARENPLVLLVDDYHWLDSASTSVLDYVARRTVPFSVGLILTTRDPIPADHGGSELRLEPLPPDVATTLVHGRTELPPQAVEKIVALAAGNPLALVELPITLTPQQIEMTDHEPVQLSPAVERAFRSRLDALPDDARRAVLYAAQEDSGSLGTVLRALTEARLDIGSIEPAIEAGLLAVDGAAIVFRHPLVRSVVHQTAAPEEIRRAHLALAAAVEDDDRRAWHLAAAAVGPDDAVSASLEEAARRALARGAAAAASAALRRAAELTTSDAERVRRFGAAARAAHRAGDMVLTERLIDETRALGSGADPAMLLLHADIRMRRGDVAGAHGALRLDAGRFAERDPHAAAAMLLLASKMRVFRFEAADAMREVEEALSLVPESEHDLVHIVSVGMTRTMAGHPGARDAVLSAMRAAIEHPHGHTHTLGIGWPLIWLDEYEQARAFISRSVDIQRDGGHRAYLPQAVLPLAELDFRTGRWDLARLNATEALRLFEEVRQPTEAAVASAMLARVEAAAGDDEAARGHAAVAEASEVRSGLCAATAFAEAALGSLDLGRGRYADAVEHLRRARVLAVRGGVGEPGVLPVEADLAEACFRAGDRASASEVTADLQSRADALGRRSATAAALRCRGLAANEEDFRPLFDEAISIDERMPLPFERARTELCYGERLRRARDRVEARGRLKIALAIFENLGAAPWAARARAELEASGETLRRQNPIATLTPQERQVASIVASGATNREAAAMLFISPKTIEFHLAMIYRKFGVRSRTELANALNVDNALTDSDRPQDRPSGSARVEG
ncbi:MAG: AAA family ATPase [Actinomycetota bacterium]